MVSRMLSHGTRISSAPKHLPPRFTLRLNYLLALLLLTLPGLVQTQAACQEPPAADLFIDIKSSTAAQVTLELPRDPANPVELRESLERSLETKLQDVSIHHSEDGTWLLQGLLPGSGTGSPLEFTNGIVMRRLSISLAKRDIEKLSISLIVDNGLAVTGKPAPELTEASESSSRYYWVCQQYEMESNISSVSFNVGFSGRSLAQRAALLAALLAAALVIALVRRSSAIRAARTDSNSNTNVDDAWFMYAMFCQRWPFVFSIVWLAAILAAIPLEMVHLYTGVSGPLAAAETYAVVFLAGLVYVQMASVWISRSALERLDGMKMSLTERWALCLASLLSVPVPLALVTIGVSAFTAVGAGGSFKAAAWSMLAAYTFLIIGRLWTIRLRGITTEELASGELRERVFALSAQAGARFKTLSIMYTGKYKLANAFALHGGAISITAQLLSVLSRRETDAVMAHEITHLRHNHPLHYRLFIAYLCIFLPVVVFSVIVGVHPGTTGSAWAAPFTVLPSVLLFFMMSRRNERICDQGAAKLTGDSDALSSALTRLYVQNRIMQAPGRWFNLLHTHPPLPARVRAIQTDRQAVAGNSAYTESETQRGPTIAPADNRSGNEPYPLPVYPGGHLPLYTIQFIQKLTLVGALTLAASLVLPPTVVAVIAQHFALTGIAWLLACIVGAGMTFEVYRNVANRRGARSFQNLETALRARMSIDGIDVSRGAFAGFAPDSSPGIYNGSYSTDVGFVVLAQDELMFYGERAHFGLNRAQIAGIEPAISVPGAVALPGITIRWRRESTAEMEVEASEGAFTVRRMPTAGCRDAAARTGPWLEEISNWYTGMFETEHSCAAEPSPVPGLPPPNRSGSKPNRSAYIASFIQTSIFFVIVSLLVSAALGITDRPDCGPYVLYPLIVAILGAAVSTFGVRLVEKWRRQPLTGGAA